MALSAQDMGMYDISNRSDETVECTAKISAARDQEKVKQGRRNRVAIAKGDHV